MKNNGKKRWGALALACTMLFSACPISAQAARFTDVPANSWYYSYVQEMAEKKIMEGTSATSFSPGSKLTRGALVTILGKMVLSQREAAEYKFQSRFPDVATSKWYSPYVNWASEFSIVNGYEDKTFRPDKVVTRQELAKMLVGFSNTMCYSLHSVSGTTTFIDSSSISSWAKSSVEVCRTSGILGGYKDGSFRPKGTATRAETASLISKFLKNRTTGNYQITRKRVNGISVSAVEFTASDYKANLALGRDLVDGAESVSSLVKRTGAKIAVNGAFFNMSNNVPLATLIKEGRVLTVDNRNAPAKPAFTMDSSGNFSIQSFSTLFSATLTKADGTEEAIHNVTFNKWPSSSTDAARILFTRDWGHTLCFPAKDAITVNSQGIITAVGKDIDATIPGLSDGFVLAQRSRREYEGKFFDSCQVGDSIAIERTYEGASAQDITLSVGAGPRLVKNGAVYGNLSTYRAEGFTDPGIVTYDAVRVCIGIKPNGRLLIAKTYSTLEELSRTMVSLGCTDAINLDGGGSANLYVNGHWLYGPQSRLLNSLIYFS